MYCSFWHIFGWWYSAGYYSYMWAEIIEADVFARIKELWMFDREVWEKFLNTILWQWTRKKATELFFDFMWREVDNVAFMERKGL
jgi:Zn-dependent oligopeptidase